MSQLPMYPASVNSISTVLAESVGASDIVINVVDASLLPAPPNIVTIGMDVTAETILYTAIIGNQLSGVTRAFQGMARDWDTNTVIARNFTAYDADAFKNNIEEFLASLHAHINKTVIDKFSEVEGVLLFDGAAIQGEGHTHANKAVLDGISAELILSWNTVTDKVDKITGKGLSTNDYTTTEQTKLAGIAEGANNYSHPANHAASIIAQDSSNRFVTDVEKSSWNAKLASITKAMVEEVLTGVITTHSHASSGGTGTGLFEYNLIGGM